MNVNIDGYKAIGIISFNHSNNYIAIITAFVDDNKANFIGYNSTNNVLSDTIIFRVLYEKL